MSTQSPQEVEEYNREQRRARKAMTAPDISPVLTDEQLQTYRDTAKMGAFVGIGGKLLQELLDSHDALRASLTAAEKLLREVHLSHNEEWLYAEDTEHSWAQRRDRFLEGLKNG